MSKRLIVFSPEEQAPASTSHLALVADPEVGSWLKLPVGFAYSAALHIYKRKWMHA
jgi:hypothetical protein